MAARSTLESIEHHYAGGEDRPLGSFLAILAVYAGMVTAFGVAIRRRDALPERVGWSDLVLIGVATHKVSRLLAKDPITSPFRAPFTRFVGPQGEAEIAESVEGRSWRKAMGELVVCPFCTGGWIATAFVGALALAPRATRLAASSMTALALSDYLQFAYAKLQENA